MMETIAIFVNDGDVTKVEKVEKPVEAVVKFFVLRALNSWDVTSSDFIVLRNSCMLTLARPLDPEILDRVSSYVVKEKDNEIVCEVPVYEILYSVVWRENDFFSKKAIVVSPYVCDYFTELLMEEAKKLAKEEGGKVG